MCDRGSEGSWVYPARFCSGAETLRLSPDFKASLMNDATTEHTDTTVIPYLNPYEASHPGVHHSSGLLQTGTTAPPAGRAAAALMSKPRVCTFTGLMGTFNLNEDLTLAHVQNELALCVTSLEKVIQRSEYTAVNISGGGVPHLLLYVRRLR